MGSKIVVLLLVLSLLTVFCSSSSSPTSLPTSSPTSTPTSEPSAVVGLFDDDATAIKELKTNLLDAVTSGSVSVVQLALNNEVISEDIAFTSSVLALYNDYASIVEVIRTKTGLDIDRAGGDGNTMLHYACIFGRENIVRQLLEAGCAVNIVNNDGDNPLQAAIKNGNVDLVSLLREYGAR